MDATREKASSLNPDLRRALVPEILGYMLKALLKFFGARSATPEDTMQELITQLTTLLSQLQGASGTITELQTALADAQAAAQANYDAGFAAGVASVGTGGGFTQEQVDAAIAAAVAPLNEQIASLQGQVSGLQSQVDGIPTQIQSALDAQKVQLKDQFKALSRGEESNLEAGIDAL